LTVYQTALTALQAGISCVPILADGTKSPALRWKDYQKRRPSPGEVRRWFSGKERGIALITGTISGGLEMLDFDAQAVYEQFTERMRREGLSDLLHSIEHGYKEVSPKGVHLYYRCSLIEGNRKLAQHPLDAPPWKESTIETRGQGGYSIAAPSPGSVHPSGKSYWVQCGSLATIPTIQPEERALLLAVARTLDELPPPQKAPHEHRYLTRNASVQPRERLPGHLFNARAMWAEILEPHGWTLVKTVGEEAFWRRPGKERGMSATTNYAGSGYLYVFSTSTLFEPCRGISKFAAYTLLEHGGDFVAAAKALADQGYVDKDSSPLVR
jgi:putative DNA primase/helicase